MTTLPLPVTDLEVGRRLLDRFVIEGELGRGGFSVVYRAHDDTVSGPVALKLLVPPPAAAREAKERLRREVQMVRGLRHPNIVGVHDFVEDGPLAFVVMDLIEGADLAARVATSGPLDVEAAIRLGLEVASALAAAHRSGILHRDIKPANILIDRDQRAWLTDFGSARLDSQATLTRTGSMIGTIGYLAPEVWLGGRPDARADLYALGVTLYQALTGKLPPRPAPHLPPTADPGGFRPSQLRPDLPPWLDQIVAMSTMADPRHRFATADQLHDALERRQYPAQPMVVAALRAVKPVEAPKPFPLTFWLLLTGIVVTGALAGIAASERFFLLTPVVVGIVVTGARRDRRERALATESEGPLEWELIGPAASAYQSLPQGTARELLADVLVLARAQVDAAGTGVLAARWRSQLEPAIATAVQAAVDLAQLDDTLSRMEEAATRLRQPPNGYWENVTALERTRDGLSTVLLELVSALGRARGASVGDFDSARFRLEEMVGDLKGDLDRSAIAAQELDAAIRIGAAT